MKSRINYTGVALLMLFAACQSAPKQTADALVKPEGATVSGIIVDATMNTLTLATDKGDTIAFSTQDATKKGELLIGDIAEVTYTDTLENRAETVPVVLKVVASPAPARLAGSWVEPTVIGDIPYQGVKLEENGAALSINMATLTYESWAIDKGQLILKSSSEGSGRPVLCVDTFAIVKLTPDSLVLENADYTLRYGKLKEKKGK